MKEETAIEKYLQKSIPELRDLATKYFNSYIRDRDKELGCISCQKGKSEHAGHFYSAGHYPGLRFLTDNCHGQCRQCNYYKSGNLNEYRKNLIIRIGVRRVELLDDKAAYFKRNPFKWDRMTLIDIIFKYK